MIELIRQRLASYQVNNALEEEQAIKEILQEVTLYLLWRGQFFDVAAFQGGTSLRILHRLPRFSEDLDFILLQPDVNFGWSKYLQPLLAGLQEFGLESEVLDRSRMDRNIREALVKHDSIGAQLNLRFRSPQRSVLKIKLEIDINPPVGSHFEYRYLDFPLDFEGHQDLPSNFALKIHALLCRPYLKGRDWFDFNWYVKQSISPNLALLQAALHQFGPWRDQAIAVTLPWLAERLNEKIGGIDWERAAEDVHRFLGTAERESLRLWGQRFFSAKVAQLVG
ncbi:hypothetical protein GCM10011487_51920 [Steroidobacter agaridevorans]|uniref:Nucleotidyl transferase AbiEii/AbiGii toxin family protein n=1 Tax=Steroidobacter agaridevorans TaxID=2695856 RepID=A0A829YK48_9GAMM|nr:nucleotidyl transferase AbiEii/AbiGii toxin family protein [Steroidobacter agaridevorans]GFE83192.1 hypothetical protein GCM10011487_51920 [Steroidobacter agaridevorans]